MIETKAGLLAIGVIVALSALFARGGRYSFSLPELIGFPDRMSADQVYRIAEELSRAYYPTVDPLMATAVAQIESSFRPGAVRQEPNYPRGDGTYGDASTGLMQTLETTAQWLHSIGYQAWPRPSGEDLKDPVTSLYFGMAYLDYLSRFNGQPRPEEFMVRAYNGGPGGASSSATVPYWAKYQAAKAELRASLGVGF